MVIKKPISLKEDLFYYAENEANKYFQGNFSMYVGYLISCHKEGITVQNNSANTDKIIKKDNEVDNIIDGIEGYFK